VVRRGGVVVGGTFGLADGRLGIEMLGSGVLSVGG
jgi:hypothetical protein